MFYKLHSAAETIIIRFSHGFSMAVENVRLPAFRFIFSVMFLG